MTNWEDGSCLVSTSRCCTCPSLRWLSFSCTLPSAKVPLAVQGFSWGMCDSCWNTHAGPHKSMQGATCEAACCKGCARALILAAISSSISAGATGESGISAFSSASCCCELALSRSAHDRAAGAPSVHHSNVKFQNSGAASDHHSRSLVQHLCIIRLSHSGTAKVLAKRMMK